MATKKRNVRKFSSAGYLQRLMSEMDRVGISQRIGEAREQAGYTQEELGDVLTPSVHWRTVQTWESLKEKTVPFDRLDEISVVGGVTKKWLLHGEDSDEAVPAAIELRLRAVEETIGALDKRTAAGLESLERAIDALGVELQRQRGDAAAL